MGPKHEILERVYQAQPAIASEAAASERLRQPTDRAMELIEATGVFRALVPETYGGAGLDITDFAEIGMALGEADISLAWVTTFLTEHCWLFSQLMIVGPRMKLMISAVMIAPPVRKVR